MRVHPDTYPTRLTSFLAQTPSGIPEWFDWDDATTPTTDTPVRFRRVAIRRRNAWGTGWDHFSKSETYAYR